MAAIGGSFKNLRRPRNFDISLLQKLLHSLINSCSLYAAGIWGLRHCEEMETIQQSYVKRSLHLPFNTPRYFVRLETGLTNLRLRIFSLAIGTWIRALSAPKGSLLSDSYYALYEAATTAKDPALNWCLQLREALDEIKMGFVYEDPTAETVLAIKSSLLQKMKEKLTQDDLTRAKVSTSIPSYHCFKTNGEPEEYLKGTHSLPITSMIINLRLGYNTLFLDGTWHKLVPPGVGNPFCKFCGDSLSLSHVTDSCPQFQALRDRFLPNFQHFDSDMTKLINHLTSTNNKIALRNTLNFLRSSVPHFDN